MPRVAGYNVVAIAIAAVAFYLIGFLWYGWIFQDTWMALTGLSAEDAAGQGWKMILGPAMPIVSVIAIATVFKWKGGSFDIVSGAATAALLCLGFAIPVVAYGYVYALAPIGLFLIDSSHLLVAFALSGAILGAIR